MSRLIGTLTPLARALYDAHMDTVDPVSVIDSLDPNELRERLHELDRQQPALRVLLRAALARQRDREQDSKRSPKRTTEHAHA
jgi:hypothetical protein